MQIQPTSFQTEIPFLPYVDGTFANLKQIIDSGLSDQQVPLLLENLQQLSTIEDLLWAHGQILALLGAKEGSVKSLKCACLFFEIKEEAANLFSSYGLPDTPDVCHSLVAQFSDLRTYLTEDQIHTLISKQPNEDGLWRISPPYKKVSLLRYNQLYDTDCGLKKVQKLYLADYIERCVCSIKNDKNIYTKKNKYSVSLPCSLQNDPSQKVVYLLLKNFRVISSIKKVTTAIQVPYDRQLPPIRVAQAVNNTSLVNNMIFKGLEWSYAFERIHADYKNVLGDAEIHRAFAGNKGIWPFLGVVKYKKILAGAHLLPKVSFLTPMASSTLSTIANKTVELPIWALIDIIDQVAHGVQVFHLAWRIVGDLKLENVLFAHLPDGTVRAGLIDFGHSFEVKGNKLQFPLEEGYYGSITPTAPELFGNKQFDGDVFTLEIWALGCLFYSLFFKEKLPWAKIIEKQEGDLESQVDKETIQSMHALVHQTIEIARETLLLKKERSVEEDCILLAYDMMRLSPDLRPDIQGVIQRIAELKELP